MTDAALLIELGLDATKVKKGIGELKNVLKDLDKQRALSTSEKDLELINRKIKIVQDQITRIKGFGLEDASKDITNGSKNARTAVTSLSLALQDLPFGFIGVQNNLPAIVQSFGLLATKSKTLGGTLTLLKAQLLGPTGIFLAFSIVTAGVTFLIQKYGSLANAVTVLTSRNKELAQSQITYNKELTKSNSEATFENAKLDILLKRLKDLKRPLKERQDAYFELNKLYPDTTAGIEKENALSAKSISIISANVAARKEYIKFKAQENAIQAVINQNAAKALPINAKVLNIASRLAVTIEKRNKLEEKTLTLQEQNTLDVLIKKEQTLRSELIKTTKEYNSIIGVNDSYLVQLDQIIGNISSYDRKVKELTDDQKNQDKETRKLTYSVKDLNNSLSFENQLKDAEDLAQVLLNQDQAIKNGIPGAKKYSYTLQERKDALEKLKLVAPQYFKNLNIEKATYEQLDDAAFTYIRTLQNLRDELISRQRASDLQLKADDNSIKALEKKNDQLDEEFQNIVKITMSNDMMSASVRKMTDINIEAVNSWIELLQEVDLLAKYYEKLDAQHVKTGKFIQQYLRNPLEELFDVVLSKGKNKWKEFGDAVVKQLKRIAAQQLATAAASLIANIIAPGSGSAIKAGLRGISTAGLGDYLSQFPDSANFSGVGSGLGVSGQVVFVQRGSDLVGVLNRTNSTINRVG